MATPDTTTDAIGTQVAEWQQWVRGYPRWCENGLANACDLLTALAADRDAWRKRAEDAEARVHGLVGCEWPGCNRPSVAYQMSTSWSGRVCERHWDILAFQPVALREHADGR